MGLSGGTREEIKMSEAWLKCTVSKGMFPDEVGVSFKSITGEEISLFCFKDFVDGSAGKIRVKVVDEQEGYALVRLPVESLNGLRVVQVSDRDLSEAREMQTA